MFKSLQLPPFLWDRNNVIVSVAVMVLFPLSMLKNLDALKYTSFLGLLGIVYCAAFLGIRYFDQSYLSGGQFFELIAENMRPAFHQANSPLVSLCLLSLLLIELTAPFVVEFEYHYVGIYDQYCLCLSL